MKVLVIGSGGREHALVWKLAQSEKVEKVFAAPGNGGTAIEEKAENIFTDGAGTRADAWANARADPLTEEGQEKLLAFAKKEAVDLVVVGPEAPLGAGIVDRFRAAGLAIVGPDKKAARLETSKVYSKSFMEKYGIRSAKSRNFKNLPEALEYTDKYFGKAKKTGQRTLQHPLQQSLPRPLVIKADGLAAGKGVVITCDAEEAKKTLRSFMKDGVLGEAGKSLVIEEYLEGFEVSMLAAVDVVPGKKGVIKPFLPSRDHKSIFEGGRGPNTGGMGAIAPLKNFTPALQKDFEKFILAPTLKGMEAEKMEYRGFIFFGLMVQDGLSYLLEYNVRLGDPEAQALLPLMDSDFAELCLAIAEGRLSGFSIRWKEGAVCAPVVAAGGYPGSYRGGDPIAINPEGLKRTGAKLFVAGAQRGAGGPSGSGLRTSGGRVLSVSALGSDADDAFAKAYEALRCVSFDDMYYRKDIGRESREI